MRYDDENDVDDDDVDVDEDEDEYDGAGICVCEGHQSSSAINLVQRPSCCHIIRSHHQFQSNDSNNGPKARWCQLVMFSALAPRSTGKWLLENYGYDYNNNSDKRKEEASSWNSFPKRLEYTFEGKRHHINKFPCFSILFCWIEKYSPSLWMIISLSKSASFDLNN